MKWFLNKYLALVLVSSSFCFQGQSVAVAEESAAPALPTSEAMPAPASTEAKLPPGRRLMQRLFSNRNSSTPSTPETPATLPEQVDSLPVTVQDEERTLLPMMESESAAVRQPLTPAELDKWLRHSLLQAGQTQPVPTVHDEQFVRRVYLDLIGHLPAPAEIQEYSASKDPQKKEKLIDRLLSLPQYGQRWGRYWKDVFVYRATAGENRDLPFDSEGWLKDQFNANVHWDEIVRALLVANGLSHETPEGFFFGIHEGKPEEMAGEAARVFLGVQLSCAQCHDHPTDVWKREQFHELAAFFGKTVVRNRLDLGFGPRGPIFQVAQQFRDEEYRMPDLQNPTAPGAVMKPVFLTGQEIPLNTRDAQRRDALADFFTSARQPLFAKAFVNRIWRELMGYSFVTPVDDLGSHQTTLYPETFDALAQSFIASDFDIKKLLRTIVLSEAYSRAFREPAASESEATEQAAIQPTRLSADQLFDSLDWVLGDIDDNERPGYRRQRGGRSNFQSIFGYDPSLNVDEIEGSIPQALALMNSSKINERISATRPGTLLNKLLKAYPDNRQIIEMLYLRVLARKPTTEELRECLSYVNRTNQREEALEDILWTLLNTSEFLHNH